MRILLSPFTITDVTLEMSDKDILLLLKIHQEIPLGILYSAKGLDPGWRRHRGGEHQPVRSRGWHRSATFGTPLCR